ncbi:MAG: Crp/Fnr family transcriptional regulator [Acidobacteriaceae bacterium]
MQNLLLNALTESEQRELRDSGEEITIQRDTSLKHDGKTEVVFPTSGMVSVVVRFQDGSSHEVGCVGSEGMTDVFGLWTKYDPEVAVFGQIAGRGLSVSRQALRAIAEKNPQARAALMEYAGRRYFEACLTAACNAHHNVPQRLAKWILTASDRIRSVSVPLTHDYLAMMLGTRRATVTVAAQKFAQDGWITYRRGHIEITDSEALAKAACECYAKNPFTASDQVRETAA